MERKNLAKRTQKENREPISKKKIAISIFLIGFAFFGSYLIYFILQIALNTSTPMVVVVSDSMAPNINKGDLLFLQGVDPEDIEIDDVIVYDAHGLWVGAPEDPIVHRVVDIIEEDDKLYFITKGDNNDHKDEEPVPANRVLGKVVARIPYVGWVKIILTDYGLLFPVIIILSVPLVVSILWDLIKGEIEEEEKKASKIEELAETKVLEEPIKPIEKLKVQDRKDDDFDF